MRHRTEESPKRREKKGENSSEWKITLRGEDWGSGYAKNEGMTPMANNADRPTNSGPNGVG